MSALIVVVKVALISAIVGLCASLTGGEAGPQVADAAAGQGAPAVRACMFTIF